MSLFVVQHRHPPERCLASTGNSSLLLSHVSAATAARYGVSIEAEAVIEGEHCLMLVVEAASQQSVERFLAFMPHQDDLQVLRAATAEEAVERGSCGPAHQPDPGPVP